MSSLLGSIENPHSVITAIESGIRFPEVMPLMREKYEGAILQFAALVEESSDSGELLGRIRSSAIPADRRMALLKIFRRCVSGVCDTEATKKIVSISTESVVRNYGDTFKPIAKLKEQFADLNDVFITTLAVSIGEYDHRGQQGYMLTDKFFEWFGTHFQNVLTIEGPRTAGPDIELSSVLSGFVASCPCDFVIRKSYEVIAVGFARYDSTRGGAQSDDRTAGNLSKVHLVREYCDRLGKPLRIIFLSDGPGLAHGDTWRESVQLDGMWRDNVRVTTLKLARQRITLDWLVEEAARQYCA